MEKSKDTNKYKNVPFPHPLTQETHLATEIKKQEKYTNAHESADKSNNKDRR
jgi:hypothetical protein